MVIAKRRLTTARLFYVCGILIVIILIRLLFENQLTTTDNPSRVQILASHFVGRKKLEQKNVKQSLPCTLFKLQVENAQSTHSASDQVQCRRVPPVPGSCDIAEELFHSTLPASCHNEKRVDICRLVKTSTGYEAKCSTAHCSLALSAACPDPSTGELVWSTLNSISSLEQHINSLLQPAPAHKKHYGFCFIGCGDGWGNYEGGAWFDMMYYEDSPPLKSVQLLVLPPSVPANFKHSQSSNKAQNRHSKSSSPYSDMNFNLIFIDSVSRQHFFRSLPKTVQLFESLLLESSPAKLDQNISAGSSDKRGHVSRRKKLSEKLPETNVFDFQLVQSVRSRTFETLQMLFSGEIDPSVKPFGVLELPPEPLKVEALWKTFKDNGYATLWLEDLCHLWEWGLSKDLLVYNKTFSNEQLWKRLQKALGKASIDSLEVTYAMCTVLRNNGVKDHFHGPNAVCFNGRHQHEYMLDYLWLYQETMTAMGVPYFTLMETNIGHEDTGKRIQQFDASFTQYLQQVLTQKNTLTVVFSDHGNTYGAFLGKTAEARMELFHPHLFLLVPKKVGDMLGPSALKTLTLNQNRLVSHLDLHYTLAGLATNFKNRVSEKNMRYNVTNRGLLSPVSPHRTCNHIPRIMPNLCICENFELEADTDQHHALFAHFAIGTINNFIQRQFQQQALEAGRRPGQGFGNCKRLWLGFFDNIKKSYQGTTMSLKMDLQVPRDSLSAWLSDTADLEDYEDFFHILAPTVKEVFFVAIQMEMDKERKHSSGGIILQTLDRITAYSQFASCADPSVKLNLCVCDLETSNSSSTGGETQSVKSKASRNSEKVLEADYLEGDRLFVEPEVLMAEGTKKCLALVVKKNEHGGVFSVANLCQDRFFEIHFSLETREMYVSDTMPREETVFPGQEIFLCMAVKTAPKVEWNWAYTLQHKMQRMKL